MPDRNPHYRVDFLEECLGFMFIVACLIAAFVL